VRIAVGEWQQPGAVEIMPDDLADMCFCRAAHAQTIGGVVPHRHPGEDRLSLKDNGIERLFLILHGN
jgi:hypothetical protein